MSNDLSVPVFTSILKLIVPPLLTLISVPYPCIDKSPASAVGISHVDSGVPGLAFSVTIAFWAKEELNAKIAGRSNRKKFFIPRLKGRVFWYIHTNFYQLKI